MLRNALILTAYRKEQKHIQIQHASENNIYVRYQPPAQNVATLRPALRS